MHSDDTTETNTTETNTTRESRPDGTEGNAPAPRSKIERVPASSLEPHPYYFALRGGSYTICRDEPSTRQARETQGSTVFIVMGNYVLSGFPQFEVAVECNATIAISRVTFDSEVEAEDFILTAGWQPIAKAKWRQVAEAYLMNEVEKKRALARMGVTGAARGDTRDIVASRFRIGNKTVRLCVWLYEKALAQNPEEPWNSPVGRAIDKGNALAAVKRRFDDNAQQVEESATTPSVSGVSAKAFRKKLDAFVRGAVKLPDGSAPDATVQAWTARDKEVSKGAELPPEEKDVFERTNYAARDVAKALAALRKAAEDYGAKWGVFAENLTAWDAVRTSSNPTPPPDAPVEPTNDPVDPPDAPVDPA